MIANNVEKQIKKVKIWNMITLVFAGIGTAFSVIGLPGTLNPNESIYKDLGEQGINMFNKLNSIPTKMFSIFGFIVSIVFVVLFFIANQKMKKGFVPSKYPYYLNLGWTVIRILFALLAIPPLPEGTETQVISLIIFVPIIIFPLLLKIPIIMILVHLFKIDIGEKTE